MSLSTLCLSFLLSLQPLEYLLIILIAIPHTFSWLLIRYSSSYFLIGWLVVFGGLLWVDGKGKGDLKGSISGWGLLGLAGMCQLEPEKMGEYVGSFGRIGVVNWVITSKPSQILFTLLFIYSKLKPTALNRPLNLNLKSKQTPSNFLHLALTLLLALSYLLKKF